MMRRPLLPLLLAAAIGPATLLGQTDEPPPVSPPPAGVESEDLSDTPEEAAGEEAEAARAYAEGDLPRAIAIYRDLAATHADPAERTRLRVTAAWLLFESGDHASAGDELGRALFDQPDYPPRPDLYSPDFLNLFEDARARAARDRAETAARKLKEGLTAARAGDAPAARTLLEASLELKPQQPRAIQGLAALDLAAGKSDEALAGFQRVIAMKRAAPELVSRELEAQALNNIGVIYLSRDQHQDAAEALERATLLAPNDARAWFNLALARLGLGRKIDGSQALERAHRLDRGDAEISLRLGRVYREAGSYVESVALLLEATAAHPQNAALFFELAQAQKGLGNVPGMTVSVGKAIDLDPENRASIALPAALLRGEEALAARDYAAAAADGERATKLAPADASGWSLLGLARNGENRLDEAARGLEKAAELAPARADVAHNLGSVYLAQRRYPEAEAAFRRALAIDPAFAESSAALARLEGARGANLTTTPARGSRPADPKKVAVPSRPGNGAVPAPPPRELGATLRAVDYQPLGIQGLLVEKVQPGSAAERAGLLVDDLILRADGKPMTQVPTMNALVRGSRAAAIAISVLRSGRPVELSVRMP